MAEVHNARRFKWTFETVGNLLECLKSFKVKMEYQGLDFDGDRTTQYKKVRKEMAKMYEQDTFLFGPVFIHDAPLPSDNQNLEEKEEYIKERRDQAKMK